MLDNTMDVCYSSHFQEPAIRKVPRGFSIYWSMEKIYKYTRLEREFLSGSLANQVFVNASEQKTLQRQYRPHLHLEESKETQHKRSSVVSYNVLLPKISSGLLDS